MAVSGVNLAWAFLMFTVMTRVCHAVSVSGYCPPRPCGVNGVEIRFPFTLQNDALSGSCYTKYPNFDFHCVEKILYLNFTGNITYSTDTFQVTKIDYFNQTLSLVPQEPAVTCRPFDASRFGGLNITNTTTLLLDCGTNIRGSCTLFPGNTSSNVCNSTGGDVNASVGGRWACPMKLNNYMDVAYNSCYLMESVPVEISKFVPTTAALELQFAGNRTLSFINSQAPPPAPASSPPPAPQAPDKSGRKRKLYIILGVVSGFLAAFIFSLLYMLYACGGALHNKSNRETERFRRKNIEAFEKMTEFNSPLSHRNHLMTTLFTLKELERATQNFSDNCKLGSGGFGTVYKGTHDNGVEVAIMRTNHTVDIKRISEQFMNEVTLLSQVSTFCLHSAAVLPIYHRDVKTSNILVDDKFNVKVADFGISKLVDHGITHVSTIVQGTVGYLDPEYFENFRLTDKCDVFSFGIVLLELLTSLKPIDLQRGPKDVHLKAMALPFLQSGNVEAIVDPGLFNEIANETTLDILEEMQRMGELA